MRIYFLFFRFSNLLFKSSKSKSWLVWGSEASSGSSGTLGRRDRMFSSLSDLPSSCWVHQEIQTCYMMVIKPMKKIWLHMNLTKFLSNIFHFIYFIVEFKVSIICNFTGEAEMILLMKEIESAFEPRSFRFLLCDFSQSTTQTYTSVIVTQCFTQPIWSPVIN